MTKNTIIGIDLAKTVFQIAVMSDNKIESNKRVNRKELRLFMTKHLEADTVNGQAVIKCTVTKVNC